MKQEEKSLFEKLYEAGEEQVSRLAKEATAHPSFASVVEKTLRSALETKGKVDQNINHILGLLNVPSKADYNKLLAKIETLQGSIVNLNIKFDRLLAAVQQPKRVSRPKRKSSPVSSSQNPTTK